MRAPASGRVRDGAIEALSRACTRRPAACLAAISLATLGLAAALPRLELRTDGSVLHPRGDPAIERTARDRRTFGEAEPVILLLTSRPGGPPVASAEGLRELSEVHRSVATLPAIAGDGVRSATGEIDVATSGVAALGRFGDRVPADPAGLDALLGRLRALPHTGGLYLSADGTAAAVYAPLAPVPDRRHAVAEIERWLAERDDWGFDLRRAGPVIAETLLGERVLADLSRLVPLMIAAVAVLLLVGLRTPAGALIALGKALVVLVWTAGLMALTGTPVTLVTTILPVLLLALCVSDEVFVLTRLQARLRSRRGGPRRPAADEVTGDLLATLRELRRPVVYTSLSTAIGFLSFLGASIVPMRHFGALAAFGILLAMLLTFTLTPALVVALPRGWLASSRGPRGGAGEPPSAGAPEPGAGRRRTAALVVGLVLLAAGVPGLARLTVQDSWIDNFDPGSPLVRAERDYNASFWGSYRYDLVLTGVPGTFHRPEGAARVVAAARAAAAGPGVGGVVTYLEPLDTVAALLGVANGVSALPADALGAVVEVAALYDRETGLDRLVTRDGGAARLLLFVDSPDYRRARALERHLERALGPVLAGSGIGHHSSGDLPVALATVGAVVRNQMRSIAWTVAGVGVLLLAVNRSLRLTLIQLVPPVAAAWLVLAGMGYAGLPLGVATSLFTALTIGVGVDLSLHLTYAFDRRRSRGDEPAQAVRAALAATAPGRRWSTVVLALGFLVLTASAFGPNRNLGLLLAAAMAASYLTTWLLVPRMLAR